MNIKNYDIFCIWSKRLKEKLKKFKKPDFFIYHLDTLRININFKKKIINKKIAFIGAYDEYRYKILSGINYKVDIYGNDRPH